MITPATTPASSTPAAPASPPESSRGRGSTVAAAIAAAAAVVAAIVVVVAVLVDRQPPAPPTGQTAEQGEPSVTGDPPTDLKLRDEGASITITWTDPSGGTVPFLIAGGRAGQPTKPMGSTSAGDTSFTVHALNPNLDYCFAVLAVYSTEKYGHSQLICTERSGQTPGPG